MKYEKLFSPITIRGLKLRNRVVMSGMGTFVSSLSSDGKGVTDELIAYHAARARGGCGLNTTEVCSVDEKGSPYGFLSIAKDEYVPRFKELCEAVHAEGGSIAIQLWQGGMCVSSDPNAEVLYPNDITIAGKKNPAITEERIQEVISAFGKAAARAVEAGFDAIEFHCAHNYLPHSFLSGGLNKRTDSWGGSFENRAKFPVECIRAIRANMPESMPLLMRIGWQDDFLAGGLSAEDVIRFCREAGDNGVDVLNISRGNVVSFATIYEVPPVDIPNGFNVEPAARIRRETGMLVMPCGRINTPDLAEEILEQDKADLVIMSRAQLADPEFCNKAREGRTDDIRYCIACGQGCSANFRKALAGIDNVKHISCLRNPAVLRENKLSLSPTDKPKKVFVIGGGIAGIEATCDLLERGHNPVLFEAGPKLGGQFYLAGKAPGKKDYNYALEKAISKIKNSKADIRTDVIVTPEILRAENPDAVIIATGSQPFVPPIPGCDNPFVFDAHDVLKNDGKDCSGFVVIIGGGLVGIEVAELLGKQGCQITVVEMKDSILNDLSPQRILYTQKRLSDFKVDIKLNTTCTKIDNNKVYVSSGNESKELPADYVIMAVGSRKVPTDDLEDACKQMNIPCYLIGDALEAPRLALNAIHEAFEVVSTI